MNSIFALWQGTWGIADYAIMIVIIAGIIAAVTVGVKAMGLAIPAWFIQILWILVIVFVVVAAIRILTSM